MKYISILRGINVSGQKKIKMEELKALYEAQGFENVVTYIQSGNVIFDSELRNVQQLITIIEQSIEKRFAFQVPVQLRTHTELKAIIAASPFKDIDLEMDGTKILLAFLSSVPDASRIDDLMGFVSAPEKLLVKGSEVYLHCPNGYGKSKLSNNFVEKKLGLVATTRNWKSVVKLYELSMP